MKRHIIKIITVLFLTIIISSIVIETQAVGLEVLDDPNAYIQESGDNSGVVDIGNIIVWVVRALGTAISILMLMIVGIKYIMGSVEEKAEYKQTMWPYIVGALLIFGGSSVTSIIYNIFNG